MKIAYEIDIVQGKTSHGDVRRQINAAISAFNLNFTIVDGRWKPVDVSTDGYMTAEMYQKLLTVDGRWKPVNVSTDGYMTAEMYQKLLTVDGLHNAVGKFNLSAKSTESSYALQLDKGGYGAPVVVDLPVHGSEDPFTAALTPAMIDGETFGYIAEFGQHIDEWEVMKQYVPISLPRLVNGVIYKSGQSTTEPGEKVFDLKSGMFLWEVKRVNGYITTVEYYQSKVGDLSVGGYPQQGRIYLSGDRTFVGVADGLCELFKEGMTPVPPTPPTPTETIETGGGANDAQFCGVIGGGGANDNYFEIV